MAYVKAITRAAIVAFVGLVIPCGPVTPTTTSHSLPISASTAVTPITMSLSRKATTRMPAST